MADPLWGSKPYNDSMSYCSGDLARPSCFLTQNELQTSGGWALAQPVVKEIYPNVYETINIFQREQVAIEVALLPLQEEEELGTRDTVAAMRMIVSSLSVLGALSIIITTIAKRQIRSPKVHPIFAISVADLMLALLWMVGGTVWLRRAPSRSWCFAISLPTVILYCVTVNLTLVYALLAYSSMKQKKSDNFLLDQNGSERVWHPFKVFLAYFIAWVLPTVIFLSYFVIVSSTDQLVADADACSCWCQPLFGNVLPFASPKDLPTATYLFKIRKLIAFNGWIVGTNYVVVFVILVVIYCKILIRIKNLRVKHGQFQEQSRESHETQVLIVQGESRARKRVVYFLTTFIVTGFFNVLLSYAIAAFESAKFAEGVQVKTMLELDDENNFLSHFYIFLFMLESLTVPIQGFLNAIVYGWTRDDFVYLVSLKSTQSEEGSMEEVLEDARMLVPDSKQEGRGQGLIETLETDTETDDSEG